MISEVYNEDCMIGMSRYPDGYFDLAIVDPPYGIDYAKRKHKTANSKIQYIPKDWDIKPPNKEYFDELKRVSKNQIIWGGNYFLEHLGNCRGMICWDKCQPEGLDQAMCEFAWVSFDKSAKIFKTSIQQIQFTRIHPTEKPIKLYKWLLDNYAVCKYCKNEGGFYEDVVGDGGSRMYVDCESCNVAEFGKPKIIDTHLGSGSSRIACHERGFDFTGFELDKDYFDAAEKRYQNHIKQLSLFHPNSTNSTPNH